jgi:predicted nucleic acid-binding Zn ribbon protein
MPDIVDTMQIQLDKVADSNIDAIRARSAVLEAAPTGLCLFCEAEVANDSRWCGPDCRDMWEDERKRNAKLQAQARV